MNKLPIKKVVEGSLRSQDTGESATLLGIELVSPNLLQAGLKIARDYDFPLMFIASRDQVDADELSGDYVNGWNQKRFQDDMRAVTKQAGFNGLYYLCRNHGGPWQRDNERNAYLGEEGAIRLARQFHLAGIGNGFDLLMIDPTKDPFEIGKVIPLDVILQRTVELIAYCEGERKRRNLPEIGYEVGTKETSSGLTSTEKYRELIKKLEKELKVKGLPMSTFTVGQTGALTRKTEQVGTYNFHNAYDLAAMARAYDVGLKEHDTDHPDDVIPLGHIPASVTASSVTPQYRAEETKAYLKLCEAEDILKGKGLLEKTSSLKKTLLVKTIKTERQRKWMVGEQRDLQIAGILKDEQLSLDVLGITGHCAFSDADVKKELRILYKNLAKHHIDGQWFVVDHIKRPLQQYAGCYHLKGVTNGIRRITE